MFKKSIVSIAVLGTAAGFACAADVTLYGVADLGFFYGAEKATVDGVTTVDTHNFGLESGKNAGSRFGLKGTEDLGNGLKVGFVLENSFNADDGRLGHDNRLFGREASLTVSGDFGKLSMGRMGGVGSSAGSYDVVYSIGDAFDGGDNKVLGLAQTSRYDNTITYQTPVFSGLQGTFQYSFKGENVKDADLTLDPAAGREGSAATDRYASAALTGQFGALNTVVAYEFLNYASNGDDANKVHHTIKHDDGHIIYLGGNYDCGFAKTFAMAQYFKGLKFGSITGFADRYDNPLYDTLFDQGVKGYGLHLGTQFPLLAGNTTVGLYYLDGTAETTDYQDGDRDAEYVGLSARYEYPLSKRTSLYTGAGFAKAKVDAASAGPVQGRDVQKQEVMQAYFGMTHKF